MEIVLRDLVDDDVDPLFDWMRDPVAVRMAAFTPEDPGDRARFASWFARIRGSDGILNRGIVVDGVLAGMVASFTLEGDREVTYWIDRALWGRGIATAALSALLALEPRRPLFGRTAAGNVGSERVLARCGFRVVGTDRDYAHGRGEETTETVHRLDAERDGPDRLRKLGVTEFLDPPVPDGASPYVPGAEPSREIRIVDPDPSWPAQAEEVARRIRTALGHRVLRLEHVGSTSVAGLPAKPVLDLDLAVADPADEAGYVPVLEAAGFVHVVREPWWYGHRLLRGTDPAVNLHVFGPDSPESARQRLFRDWLRTHPGDRDEYARAKREAAAAATAAGEHVQQYNARKEQALRAIYARAFAALGLA